jgi:hypothetical protein
MESKRGMFWVAAISGMVGAGVGSVSGSNSVLVTLCVGIIIALLVAWGIAGFLK